MWWLFACWWWRWCPWWCRCWWWWRWRWWLRPRLHSIVPMNCQHQLVCTASCCPAQSVVGRLASQYASSVHPSPTGCLRSQDLQCCVYGGPSCNCLQPRCAPNPYCNPCPAPHRAEPHKPCTAAPLQHGKWPRPRKSCSGRPCGTYPRWRRRHRHREYRF